MPEPKRDPRENKEKTIARLKKQQEKWGNRLSDEKMRQIERIAIDIQRPIYENLSDQQKKDLRQSRESQMRDINHK